MKKLIERRQQASLDMPLLERVLAARGVTGSPNYGLENLLKPDKLKNLSLALDVLTIALEKQSRVLIVGDFDADGATSCAVCFRSLKSFGFKHVDYVVPNRFDFGYGLTPEIIEFASPLKPELIITVDNGISSVEGVSAANSLGIKVLVTDHHLPGEQLPDAEAIVNPNLFDCEFPSKNLAGVGVIFYLMSAFRSKLREEGYFDRENIPVPNMANLIDIVALGTVADVVPLDYNNRILVAYGLSRMRAGLACSGIKALLTIAGRNIEAIEASDLGFAVGPRLNAAGRLDDMSLGIRCLLAETDAQAIAIARELDDLNKDRRLIEGSIQKEAIQVLDALTDRELAALPFGVILYKPDWHQGVVGIVASRIKDRLYRPTIVFAQTDGGELKGSGRSIPGVHLRDVLDEVATGNPGLLTKFGGHAMAAGLTLESEKLDEFRGAFDRAVRRAVKQGGGKTELVPVLVTDGELADEELSLFSAQQLQEAGPWGQGFPEPSFDGEFHLVQQRIVGEKHLKMVVSPVAVSGKLIDAIAFNVDTKLWPSHEVERVKLVFKLSINEFRGNTSLQFIVDYIEAA